MSKRQKKTREEVIYKSLALVVFLILIASYNNCSDIRLLGSISSNSSSNNTNPPPGGGAGAPDPRADTVNFTGATEVTSTVACQTDGAGGTYAQGDLTIASGPNTPKSAIVQGINYPMIIATGGVNGCTEPSALNNWDPLSFATGPNYIKQRHNTFFPGIIAFRIRTPKEAANIQFQYFQQNGLAELGQNGHFSVSKIPGDIDPVKSNSQAYCNLQDQDSMDSSDTPGGQKCRLLQDSVYYVNVLNSYTVINKKTDTMYTSNGAWFTFSLFTQKK